MSELSEGQTLNLMFALDEIEDQLAILNETKRDLFKDAREQMHDVPKKDVNLLLSAIKKVVADERKARLKPEAAEADAERDALAERLAVLFASRSALRTSARADTPDWSAVKAAASSFSTPNDEAA